YRKKTDFSLGARTQLFIQNVSKSPLSLKPDTNIRLRGRTPKELLEADEGAWYDFPDAWKDQPLTLGPQALTEKKEIQQNFGFRLNDQKYGCLP
ncbi:MAG: hypothetical protein ACYSU4_10080, partial [Planctomycetota bacterium]